MGVEKNAKKKLYIRLPVVIKEELQIKDLNKNIKEVFLPRQKSSRWCTVSLVEDGKLKKTIEEIKKVKVGGKNIVVKEYTRKEQPKRKVNDNLTTDSLKALLKA